MSARAASARPRAERSRRASRRAAVRRRRALLLLCALGIVALAFALSTPLFKKAVSELSLPLAYQDIIREQAAEKHLDPALVAAVIYAETKFDARASAAGAQGLMQLMPQTAAYLAHRSGATTFTTADLATPSVNIAYGSYYLHYLLARYHGNEVLALAAYNGGETNVDEWIARARSQGRSLTIQAIPFPETQAYVERVLQAQRTYRATYASQLGY